MPNPLCVTCKDNWDEKVFAEFFAAQSTGTGKTVSWIPVCSTHLDGWNSGGDWIAPAFAIGRAATIKEMS